MKTIIKIEPEWNNAHCYLENVDYDLPFWAELPAEFASVWEENKPFVSIVTDESGTIIGMTPCEEILPEPEPEPTPEEDIWGDIANAIREGVNEV